jgi:hypothetical protein
LKCKEVWVEGSYDFRNPSEDLPSDWGDEQCRTLHYQALGKPQEAQAFVRLLRRRLHAIFGYTGDPLSRALSPLLIMDLFGEATNMGIKQVTYANDRYGYDELL